jgi:hypothetical protein
MNPFKVWVSANAVDPRIEEGLKLGGGLPAGKKMQAVRQVDWENLRERLQKQ